MSDRRYRPANGDVGFQGPTPTYSFPNTTTSKPNPVNDTQRTTARKADLEPDIDQHKQGCATQCVCHHGRLGQQELRVEHLHLQRHHGRGVATGQYVRGRRWQRPSPVRSTAPSEATGDAGAHVCVGKGCGHTGYASHGRRVYVGGRTWLTWR